MDYFLPPESYQSRSLRSLRTHLGEVKKLKKLTDEVKETGVAGNLTLFNTLRRVGVSSSQYDDPNEREPRYFWGSLL